MQFKAATFALLVIVLAGSLYFVRNGTIKIIVRILLIGLLLLGITYPYLPRLF